VLAVVEDEQQRRRRQPAHQGAQRSEPAAGSRPSAAATVSATSRGSVTRAQVGEPHAVGVRAEQPAGGLHGERASCRRRRPR
jgi:hypothetical protein